MIQLKKRVARLKVQHFLRENKLVLFFHYNLNQNNKRNKSLCNIKTQLMSLGQGNIFFKKNRIAHALSKEHSLKNAILSGEQIKQQTALFQGPATLLGVENVSQLHEVLKMYKQKDVLVLLGGIYNNQGINCIQLERLDRLSREGQISLDLHLMRCIQRPVLQVLSTLSAHPFYSILDKAKYRLLEILNWRVNQLSTLLIDDKTKKSSISK